MTRPSLKYGLLSGVIMALAFLTPFLIFKGEDLYSYFKIGEIIGYSTMILCLLFVFFGMKSYRDTEMGGSITFGRAFASGLVITAIAALIFAIFTVLLYKFITPELGEQMMDFYKRSIIESGKPQEVIDAQLAEMNDYRDVYNNSAFHGGLMFATVFMIGAVIAFISSFILKRKKS